MLKYYMFSKFLGFIMRYIFIIMFVFCMSCVDSILFNSPFNTLWMVNPDNASRVAELLDEGEDPNETINGTPVWPRFLHFPKSLAAFLEHGAGKFDINNSKIADNTVIGFMAMMALAGMHNLEPTKVLFEYYYDKINLQNRDLSGQQTTAIALAILYTVYSYELDEWVHHHAFKKLITDFIEKVKLYLEEAKDVFPVNCAGFFENEYKKRIGENLQDDWKKAKQDAIFKSTKFGPQVSKVFREVNREYRLHEDLAKRDLEDKKIDQAEFDKRQIDYRKYNNCVDELKSNYLKIPE
jgi:hypothetical protein